MVASEGSAAAPAADSYSTPARNAWASVHLAVLGAKSSSGLRRYDPGVPDGALLERSRAARRGDGRVDGFSPRRLGGRGRRPLEAFV